MGAAVRTDDVLAMIDAATEDLSTPSGDAMRWTPPERRATTDGIVVDRADPVLREYALLDGGTIRVAPLGTADWSAAFEVSESQLLADLGTAARAAGETLAQLGESMRRAARSFRLGMERLILNPDVAAALYGRDAARRVARQRAERAAVAADSPRARAEAVMAARRARNTGPDRPTGQRAHRPRGSWR
jgi:hypothetical protein